MAEQIKCYDCETVYPRDERECPNCAMRTCINEGYELDVVIRDKSGARWMPGPVMMDLVKRGLAKFRWT